MGVCVMAGIKGWREERKSSRSGTRSGTPGNTVTHTHTQTVVPYIEHILYSVGAPLFYITWLNNNIIPVA